MESEAGNFSLFRSKQNVLTNHLQGRARNKRADNQSRKIWCGATGLQLRQRCTSTRHLKESVYHRLEILNPSESRWGEGGRCRAKNSDLKLDLRRSGLKPASQVDDSGLELRCDVPVRAC